MIVNQIGRFGNALWFLNFACGKNTNFVFNLYDSQIKNSFDKYFHGIRTVSIKRTNNGNYYQNIEKLCDKNIIKQYVNELKITEKYENVMHIRVGDYANHFEYKKLIPSNEYVDIQLQALNINRNDIICITDSADFVTKKYGLTCLQGTTDLYDFQTMINARRIIMSPSSFSWWGAYLSNAEKIVFPRRWIYDLMDTNDKTSVSRGIDLLPKQSRYIVV